jgi:hypothetical protein
MRWRRSSHSSPRGWAANYSSPTEWAITKSTGLRWRLLEAEERREEPRVVEFLLVHENVRIRPHLRNGRRSRRPDAPLRGQEDDGDVKPVRPQRGLLLRRDDQDGDESTAKTPQISQFVTYAAVCQPPVASASRMSTGMSASVATRTSGSSGVRTRPDSSCLHTTTGFWPRLPDPSAERTWLGQGQRPSAAIVHESDPEERFPKVGGESPVQDVALRRVVIVDPPASYLVAEDPPERSAVAADAEPEFFEREAARRLQFSSPQRRGILGAPLAFALHSARDLSLPPVPVSRAPTSVVRLRHCPILTVPRDRQTDGRSRCDEE